MDSVYYIAGMVVEDIDVRWTVKRYRGKHEKKGASSLGS